MSNTLNLNRLDRIEEKIDKLSAAIISLARVEEKIANLEKSNNALLLTYTKTSDRLEIAEIQIIDIKQTTTILNRISWAVISAGVISGIAYLLNSTLRK